MVGGVVHHDDGVLSPVALQPVKVPAELNHEPHEGVCVSLASVDSECKLASAAYRRYDVGPLQVGRVYQLVVLTSYLPTSRAVVCLVQGALIHVDDPVPKAQVLYVLGGCKLPLVLGVDPVMERADALDLPV